MQFSKSNWAARGRSKSANPAIEPLESRRLLTADFVSAVAIGGAGNEYVKHTLVIADDTRWVVGTFTGACDFAPGKKQFVLKSNGGADVFVAKYAGDGTLIWARQLGGKGDDEAGGVSLVSDNVIVSGGFTGTVDFSPTASVDLRTSNGREDAFVWRLSGNGKLVWARTAGGAGNDVANDVTQTSGVLAVVGSFRESANFRTGKAAHVFASKGGRDGFIWQLSQDTGLYAGFRQIGSAGDDAVTAATIPANGIGLTVVGDFQKQLYLGYSTRQIYDNAYGYYYDEGDVYLYPSDAQDVFYATYDGALRYTGSDQYRGAGVDHASDVSEFVSSGKYVAVTTGDAGGRGAALWYPQIGVFAPVDTSGDVVSGDIDIDRFGNVWFGGTFGGSGGGLTGSGGTDAYVGLLRGDSSQQVILKSVGGPGNDRGGAVSVLPKYENRNPYAVVGGSFQGTADLDPGPGAVSRKSAGGDDAFFEDLSL